MMCTTSDHSNIEYTIEDKTKMKSLPILVSPHGDGQDIGSDIDINGVFRIKNLSEGSAYTSCELYNKFGD